MMNAANRSRTFLAYGRVWLCECGGALAGLLHVARAHSQAKTFIVGVRGYETRLKQEAKADSERLFPKGTGEVDVRRWLAEDSPWHPYLKRQFTEGLTNAYRAVHASLIENCGDYIRA